MTATEVAAGAHTGYAIGSDGNLYAWGNGGDGELGNGTTTEAQATPVVVSLPAGVTATALAAGEDTAYAIGSDGNLYAWGNGVRGALGNGTTTFAQATPVVVSLPAAVTATAVAAGAFTGYAIGSDGNLYAWGSGGDGELGNGTTTETQATPVVVSLPAGDTASAVGVGNVLHHRLRHLRCTPHLHPRAARVRQRPGWYQLQRLHHGHLHDAGGPGEWRHRYRQCHAGRSGRRRFQRHVQLVLPFIYLPAQTSRATSSARSRCSSPRRSSGPRTQTWQ